jgi:hypothetical protein
MPQIHQEECEVVENVGGCHPLIKFEAIKESRFAINEANVA